jgi:prephenate dehydratase
MNTIEILRKLAGNTSPYRKKPYPQYTYIVDVKGKIANKKVLKVLKELEEKDKVEFGEFDGYRYGT